MEITAARDSVLAAIRISSLESELAYARENERRWWHDPKLHFVLGAVTMGLVVMNLDHLSF